MQRVVLLARVVVISGGLYSGTLLYLFLPLYFSGKSLVSKQKDQAQTGKI